MGLAPVNAKIFSLLEVTRSIQKTLAERYSSSFWVKAEMNKLNYYPHSGHCYPDLVEKKDGKVIAQLRSTLWNDDYMRINRNFLRVLKTPLRDGINMLFCARITFDPAHGLALRIIDIDPAFSLGELEREKQETIEKLKHEGIFDRNRSLKMPLVPKRIAIISVQTSKGYADFMKVTENNAWGYTFFQVLFPSLLQGERAVENMLYQLERIRKVSAHFDVVAIIRGGGGEVGLSSFNNFELSKAIALFPIPVITGIGHATNETVVEMIAFKNAITPTDLANYLIGKFHEFAGPVQEAQRLLVDKAKSILDDERGRFRNSIRYFRSVTDNALLKNHHLIAHNTMALVRHSGFLLETARQSHASATYEIKRGTLAFCHHKRMDIRQYSISLKKDTTLTLGRAKNAMENLERSIANMSPENVLKRGYSLTMLNGKIVKSYQGVRKKDVISTLFADGVVTSEVTATTQKTDEL